MLQSIRSSVERSDRTAPVSTAASITSAELRNPSADVMPPSSADGSVDHVDSVSSYSVNSDDQIAPSSSTYCSPWLLNQSSFEGSVSATSAVFDASSAESVAFSEAKITMESFGECTNASAPQPAHYAAAPSAPQPKMPKYERVFIHDLPPTLPLPPVVGTSSTQYPSQEEVIGPKRRKEPQNELNEKDAIRSWYRQFDQRRAKLPTSVKVSAEDSDSKNRLLKPKNIPFASPYIQTNDASSKLVDDPAAKEFDPSIPPPSAAANST